jgi:cytidine diphosphoramidate kinase
VTSYQTEPAAKPGRVFWITGLAGSGKSTIAHELTEALRAQGRNVVYLDGDILRAAIAEDIGYSPADRLIIASRYGRFCKLLADQGIWVVGAFIALIHEVQNANRENIDDYVEVFVSVPMEELIARDQKGLYSRARAGEVENVIGIDIPAEFPQTPEIVVENHGGRSATQAVEEIMERWG